VVEIWKLVAQQQQAEELGWDPADGKYASQHATGAIEGRAFVGPTRSGQIRGGLELVLVAQYGGPVWRPNPETDGIPAGLQRDGLQWDGLRIAPSQWTRAPAFAGIPSDLILHCSQPNAVFRMAARPPG
jgi:hypothetical protein